MKLLPFNWSQLKSNGVTMTKAKAKDTDKARQIVAVDVEEVSLVDKPAIRREFLIIKRLEDTMSGAFDEETRTDQVNKQDGDDKNQAAAEENKGDSTEATTEESGASEDAATEEGGQEASTEEGATEESGSGDDDKTPVEKDNKPVPAVQMFEDGTIIVKGQPVNKGQVFTEEKANKVKSALEAVLKELTPESTTQKGVKKDAGNQEQPNTVSTKLDEVLKAIGDVKKGQQKLEKRVEDIEKTREPSQSVEDEGVTDTQEVKKSFWNGVV